MSLKIDWSSTPHVRHEALFIRTPTGVRATVTTYRDNGTVPDGDGDTSVRVETGPMDKMLPVLFSPTGRYRLAPMLEKRMEERIRAHFETESGTDLAPLSGANMGNLASSTLPRIHPTMAPFLAAVAPANSIYAAPASAHPEGGRP